MESKIKGNLVDVHERIIYPAVITIIEGKIVNIEKTNEVFESFILPGLIDSHVHIESSMLTPSGFAHIAVQHGTIGVVSDPHEIANVIGAEGVEFMIRNGKTIPFKFFFGAPSCVPATEFESSGGQINPEDVDDLLKREDVYFLSEMMNFPGVINGNKEIGLKIASAHKYSKPIDGHAPGLTGKDLEMYIKAGITTDHECVSLDEAVEKISHGMRIQIREGSAARGFDLFSELIGTFPEMVMLCTDDLHPNDLVKGHINLLLARGVAKGINIFDLLNAACLNPVLHYNLPVGLLRIGDPADLIVVNDLKQFEVLSTYINGELVYNGDKTIFNQVHSNIDKEFRTKHITQDEIVVPAKEDNIRVIEVFDGELFTGNRVFKAKIQNGIALADTRRDICKIVVVNKYELNQPAVGFITGFGLKHGALAGSVAHDSHNVIAVGTNDEDIENAINKVIDMKGGLAAFSDDQNMSLQLEIAGLMTNRDGRVVAGEYSDIENFAKSLGSKLRAPFMSLSFMALLVIPELKIGDKGLFDVANFSFTSLFVK
ncbi:MAG: adenine deaminase [Bacteroidales bacterium]